MTISLLIVVPTLNSHVLLPRLVRSLQQQSWPNWRLLFIDGPSGQEHRRWLDHCCATESRCSWFTQDPAQPGIFGAMNQGFIHASSSDWLLFWGSDDWAAGPNVLRDAIAAIETSVSIPDLLVCRGRYIESGSGAFARPTVFQPAGLLSVDDYRSALFFGSTPPHQATFVGPGARNYLACYLPSLRLSADLDYFLQLSRHPSLRVRCLDLEFVHMADGGVSAQYTWRRLHEVRYAYLRAFTWRWWFPFFARYIKRFSTLFAFFDRRRTL